MRITFHRLLTGLVALSAVVLLAGCSDSKTASETTTTTGGAAPSKDKVKIAFIVKQPEEDWFQREWKFADEAAAKDGFELIKLPATEGDKVIAVINNAAAQGAQGLVICSPDVKLGPAIVEQTKKSNMKLLTVDDQLVGPDGKFLDVPHVGISAAKIGNMVGDSLMAEMKRRGWKPEETGLMVVTFEQLDTARQRTDGEIEAAKKAGFAENMIFKAAEKTSDIPGSRDAANPVLTQHPNIKNWLIASMNDSGVIGAVRATEALQITPDHVVAIGINGDQAVEEFKKSQPTGVFGSVLLQAKRHGFDTCEMMYNWITKGTEPPKLTYTDGILITRENYQKTLADQGVK